MLEELEDNWKVCVCENVNFLCHESVLISDFIPYYYYYYYYYCDCYYWYNDIHLSALLLDWTVLWQTSDAQMYKISMVQ